MAFQVIDNMRIFLISWLCRKLEYLLGLVLYMATEVEHLLGSKSLHK